MKLPFVAYVVAIIATNAAAAAASTIALFQQSRPEMAHASYLAKLLASEFWVSVQWCFAIVAFKLGYQTFSAPQLFLVQYAVGFGVQLLADKYWLHEAVTVDHYVTMALMVVALFTAKFKLLG
jgi:uncharacterized protein (DUF486 family)